MLNIKDKILLKAAISQMGFSTEEHRDVISVTYTQSTFFGKKNRMIISTISDLPDSSRIRAYGKPKTNQQIQKLCQELFSKKCLIEYLSDDPKEETESECPL